MKILIQLSEEGMILGLRNSILSEITSAPGTLKFWEQKAIAMVIFNSFAL